MTKINISGVIVGHEYDLDELSGFIDKGFFTPSSRFERALTEADGDDIEVWLNSPGGDVLAGNEMLARFQSYPGKKTLHLGGFVGSMAANFALQAGCKVVASENTLLMFHSARAITEGGPGALRDEAACLERINGMLIDRLKALGVPAEIVDEGFREGRELTMSAQEALQYHIVDKIAKGATPIPQKPGADELEALRARNDLHLAALFDFAEIADKASVTAQTDEPAHSPDSPVEAVNEAHEAVVQAMDGSGPGDPPAPCDAQRLQEALAERDKLLSDIRTIQSSCAKKINEVEAAAKKAVEDEYAKTESVQKQLDDLRAESTNAISSLHAQVDDLTAKLQASRSSHARLVGHVLGPDPDEGVMDAKGISAMLDTLPDAKARCDWYSTHRTQIQAAAKQAATATPNSNPKRS